VKSIVTWDRELEEAFAPMSITVCLEDEIDVSRGDMLVPISNPPHTGRRFEATVVWMNEKPLEPHRPYVVKHTTQMVQGRVREIRHRVDINTLGHQRASQLLLNEIAVVSVETQRPLFFDAYRIIRATGGFILIDPITNETVGAGMVIGPDTWRPSGPVTPAERVARIGHRPFVIRLVNTDHDTALRIERHLFDQGYLVHVIEGWDIRGADSFQGPFGRLSSEAVIQAVRTAFAAGMVALLCGAAAQDPQTLRAGVPAGQLLTFDRLEFRDDAALLSALLSNLSIGPGGTLPFTDGAGI
jgi:hypothetical protein